MIKLRLPIYKAPYIVHSSTMEHGAPLRPLSSDKMVKATKAFTKPSIPFQDHLEAENRLLEEHDVPLPTMPVMLGSADPWKAFQIELEGELATFDAHQCNSFGTDGNYLNIWDTGNLRTIYLEALKCYNNRTRPVHATPQLIREQLSRRVLTISRGRSALPGDEIFLKSKDNFTLNALHPCYAEPRIGFGTPTFHNHVSKRVEAWTYAGYAFEVPWATIFAEERENNSISIANDTFKDSETMRTTAKNDPKSMEDSAADEVSTVINRTIQPQIAIQDTPFTPRRRSERSTTKASSAVADAKEINSISAPLNGPHSN